MNWRKPAYLAYASVRVYRFPALLRQYLADYESGLSGEITAIALSRLLSHCRQMVPYYGELLSGTNLYQLENDPRSVLQSLPVLTKDSIRANSSRLQSTDNARRNCQVNTSGGSTGEPVRLVQDD